MKKKIIGFFVCMMLITGFLTSAQEVSKKNIKLKNVEAMSFDQDDVPIWQKGDMWEYKIDRFTVNLDKDNVSLKLNIQLDNLPMEVDEVLSDSYKLTFNAPFTCDFDIEADLDNGPLNISGEFKDTTISGTITRVKSDLGLKGADLVLDGKILLDIKEQPIPSIPNLPIIPFPLTVNINLDLENSFPLIEFPINTTKIWGLPANNITLTGNVESLWLKLVGAINKIIQIPFVLNIVASLLTIDPAILQEYTDMIANLTPVLDIEYVLDEFMGGNVFQIEEVPPVLFCLSRDNITVPAGGPFDCYNISIGVGVGNIYYSPDVGNIVKVVGNFEEILPFITNINAELISYQFTP